MNPLRQLPFTLITGCLLVATTIGATDDAAVRPPNIVFILVDDQRNDTLGCAGHPVIKTPVIDDLATQGTRFTNAFVTTSICMSSRATILTGIVMKSSVIIRWTSSGPSRQHAGLLPDAHRHGWYHRPRAR